MKSTAPQTEEDLEDLLSRPTQGVMEVLATLPGDLLVLGAGGKMGPSLARMAQRGYTRRQVRRLVEWYMRVNKAG